MEYQSLIQLMTSKNVVMKVTPLILSVSVFSFIFSNSCWPAFLLRFFKFYFSSLPMQLISHALDKSWIFLICNGILVVIANTSGMVNSPSAFDLHDLLQYKIADGLQAPALDAKENSLEVSERDNAVPELAQEIKENDAKEGDDPSEEEQAENSCLILDDEEEQEQETELIFITEGRETSKELQISCINMGDEENEEEEFKICFVVEDEDHEQLYDEEEEEEEGMDKLSTEELNKKFDDFIRKMKEELRIQAQQQLVPVK